MQRFRKTTVGFQMKYFEELKYEQISEILGTSVGALKLHTIMP
jgi:RNA polymerase sigma-70 factor (ECF subfamily)